ncbi:hypothetical protein ACFWBX_20035 [Streptomyces sp. NPDC059991]|uniref:hypothetical protein n=1 Tax=Streptomyces sp. NPDC059991 TaxID=3347028 RepID=UPI00367B80CA
MREEFGGSDVALPRVQAEPEAEDEVSVVDVVAQVVCVRVSQVEVVGVEGFADGADVQVAEEQVAGAGAEVEAEPPAAGVLRRVWQLVPVVDVQAADVRRAGMLLLADIVPTPREGTAR